MTTAALRDEFRRDPGLPMLLGHDIFIRGIRLGIKQGDYVYQRGDLLFGPGDPPAGIRIDEQAVVMTMAYAKNKGLWPRQESESTDDDEQGSGSGGGESGSGHSDPDRGGGRRPLGPGLTVEFSADGVLRRLRRLLLAAGALPGTGGRRRDCALPGGKMWTGATSPAGVTQEHRPERQNASSGVSI